MYDYCTWAFVIYYFKLILSIAVIAALRKACIKRAKS